MDWARILAFATGMVDQELLARIEYFGTHKAQPRPHDRIRRTCAGS
jgi:hypothetical protein